MPGSVVQINVSPGGLPKRAVPEATVTATGIAGDACVHPQFHGGLFKAILLVSSEVIDDLILRGYPLFYGALGENITMRGIDHCELRSGQRYRIGEVFIELTTLRVPCRALDVYGPNLKAELYDAAVKAGDVRAPRWAKGGFYASILQTGRIHRDDIIALVDQAV